MQTYELTFNDVKITCIIKEGKLALFRASIDYNGTRLFIHEIPVRSLETLIDLLEEGNPESIKKLLIQVKDARLREVEALKKVIKNL